MTTITATTTSIAAIIIVKYCYYVAFIMGLYRFFAGPVEVSMLV